MAGTTTFIYMRKAYKLVYLKTRKTVKLKHVYDLYLRDKNRVRILEHGTMADVKDEIIQKAASKYDKPKSVINSKEYGPDAPLNTTKLYDCQDCGTITPNRFKCSRCWDEISEMDDADHIYAII